MKRGHSNVHNLDRIVPYPTAPERVLIPLIGGANVYTVKELPPLSLDIEEWKQIGEKAGWLTRCERCQSSYIEEYG